MNVRLRSLPLQAMMAAGGVTGFVAGLFVGCLIGALLTWFAGSVLDWHRQLGFTLGVTEQLLPLGEQIGLLQAVSDRWWLVIPVTGVVTGLLNGLIGLLAGGSMAALYNRFGHGIPLEVELEAAEAEPEAGTIRLPRRVTQ